MVEALLQSYRVQEYFRRRERILYELESKSLESTATLDDLADAIHLLKSEHALLRALFRQCGIAL